MISEFHKGGNGGSSFLQKYQWETEPEGLGQVGDVSRLAGFWSLKVYNFILIETENVWETHIKNWW